jgi:hypothetical protein
MDVDHVVEVGFTLGIVGLLREARIIAQIAFVVERFRLIIGRVPTDKPSLENRSTDTHLRRGL